MELDSAVSAFILAGGKSIRMGSDKAFAPLHGRTLLARILDVARSLTPNVYIVGEPGKYAPFAAVVEDVYTNCGPLGGIHAALHSSATDLNVVLAVDVPFVSLALLRFMVSRAKKSARSLVTVARANGGLQPLCAVYRREFAEVSEKALRSGRYKIDALFGESKTQVVSQEELEVAGFSPAIFRNLNTPDELAEAEK